MTNAHGKEVDKTYLSVDNAESRGFIHRDYIAHCLRWSHVCKRLMRRSAYKKAVVLDIGCGKELPLAKLLYSSRMFPYLYYGIDAGKIDNFNFGKYDDAVALYEQEDFAKTWETINQLLVEDETPLTHVVCFEVLEHVEPKHCIKILRAIRKMCTDDTEVLISTPNWNGRDTAGNHVNEIRWHVLYLILNRLGFHVEDCYGTFASQTDYKHLLTIEERTIFNQLSEYYDSDLVSCLFAPLYPAESRNCLWILKKCRPIIDPMPKLKEPWSSSEKWEDFKHA